MFISFSNSNPECEITSISSSSEEFSYGIYINGPKKGQEFFEWYKGPNYIPTSKKKNWSRHYTPENLPRTKLIQFNQLKEYYLEHFFNPDFQSIFAL